MYKKLRKIVRKIRIAVPEENFISHENDYEMGTIIKGIRMDEMIFKEQDIICNACGKSAAGMVGRLSCKMKAETNTVILHQDKT